MKKLTLHDHEFVMLEQWYAYYADNWMGDRSDERLVEKIRRAREGEGT